MSLFRMNNNENVTLTVMLLKEDQILVGRNSFVYQSSDQVLLGNYFHLFEELLLRDMSQTCSIRDVSQQTGERS